jgi:4-hydroxybenzoate polyprenyltransferase
MSSPHKWFIKRFCKSRRAIAAALCCLGIGMLLVIFLPFWIWIAIVAAGLISYAWSWWR